ncbi:ribosomal 40S subunit protein S15 [Starmerella bacillaris]|uniref:Ribosomal 40S subunit protein S15 n=1 Tax=Starmerella bacillaris TaxID=1247836 RepID=A0AAV5RFV4_STABA|nr:ribosomal 40S subunit protein S15 [Starmerella bacillaris]
MADVQNRKRKSLSKISFRGVDAETLLNMSTEEFKPLLRSRGRRKFTRGIPKSHERFLEKLQKKKQEANGQKPAVVKTHLRNCMIIPEMIGSVIAVYNGKVFNVVDVRPEMLGRYLGEFSITYKPVARRNPNGNLPLSRMVSLK